MMNGSGIVIGLDVGGANIKASDGERRSVSRQFPLWREPERLAGVLREIVSAFPDAERLAVSMTGELADCFRTKADGVHHILSAVEQAAQGMPIEVWQTGGEFVGPEDARELVPLVAAANWHALAAWVARAVPRESGLLIDIGSTTTDIIPLRDGMPVPGGRSDLERLATRELVYSGVRRTPVCAVASEVSLRLRPGRRYAAPAQTAGSSGRNDPDHAPAGGDRASVRIPLAAELFATMLDVYIVLDQIPEDAADHGTANGRPATRNEALVRLARMLCADTTEVEEDDLLSMARELADRQHEKIAAAVIEVMETLGGRCHTLIAAGEGEFLVQRLATECRPLTGVPVMSLGQMLGPDHSRAACAFALARLATET